MKQKSSRFALVTGTLVIAGALVAAHPSFAASLTELVSGSIIRNGSADNALSIIQSETVGKGRTNSGAFFLDNTGNANTGMTLYSGLGSGAAQPLMRMEVTNPSWDEEVLYIRSDSPTSRGLIRLDSPAPEIEFVETDQDGAAGKFEVRVQHDEFQINSRRADDTTFEKKITMSHEGDLTLHEGGLTAAGGVNITGGCLAINGKCLDLGDIETSERTSDESTTAAPATSGTTAVGLSAGAPRDIDCNSYTERGRMVLDHEQNRLYVCNGPERGWDYSDLSD